MLGIVKADGRKIPLGDVFPSGKYEIIYADPPWDYKDKALAGNRGACCKYPVQSHEWLLSLPVAQIAAQDCCLFLWVTMPKLNQVFEVISAWGFEYKTCAFVWVKRNKRSLDWFWGMGRWTRANAELCLLATKGMPKRMSAGVHSVIDDPIGDHSQKPRLVRKRIVELCGDKPRIELFSRESVKGWSCWGNNIGPERTAAVQRPLLAPDSAGWRE